MIGAVLIAMAPLIVITGTVYTFTVPKMYRAQARIKVNNDAITQASFGDAVSGTGYDPYFLRTQVELIKSTPIMKEVINRLNLQQVWGYDGEPMPMDTTCQILSSSLDAAQFRDTSLIALTATRPDPREAKRLANTLAEVYLAKRLDQKQEDAARILDKLRQEIEKQQACVDAAEAQIQEDESPEQQQAQRDLELQRSLLKALTARLPEIIAQQEIRTPVEIIDPALEPMSPVSPNLILNSLLSLGVAGIFVLIGIPLLIIGFTRNTN